MKLAEFAKEHFKLRILYEPVWSHALAGLKWGALAGICLKLADTFMLLDSVDRTLGGLFLAAIAFAVSLWVALRDMAAPIILTAVALFVTKFVDLSMGRGTRSGAHRGNFGLLAWQAVGGAIGLVRQKSLPRAKDALPEPGGLLLKMVIFPLVVGAAVWVLYLLFFNPWITSVLAKE